MIKITYQNYKSDYIYLVGGNTIDIIDEKKFNELYNMTQADYNKYNTKRNYKSHRRNKYTNIFHIYSLLVANALLSDIQKKNNQFLEFLYNREPNEIDIINKSAKNTLICFYGGKIPMLC
jgi:hypothetical protein